MIHRIFHPIGQGAFYSERHGNFNIVYDCGNWKNTKLADKVVENSFTPYSIIDILFISHFDYDHVSKIGTLKKNFKIKKVVLPLLENSEKIFLMKIYDILGYKNILSLINNPEEYFGNNTIVIKVKMFEKDKMAYEDLHEQIDITTINKNCSIRSGVTIKINDWFFIPYNFEYRNRREELKDIFRKKGIDIDKLKDDINYLQNKRKIIKEAYNCVSGNINQNSMILYSGPSEDKKINKSIYYGYNDFYKYYIYNYYIQNDRVGCIYTGDADLNITKVNIIFKKYWDNVGTIQIPHHGDLKSFNINILDHKRYFCPISFGTTNPYGHPSNQLLSNIYKKYSMPIFVTEKLDSVFFEICL